MKTNIYKAIGGAKPILYENFATKKEAKQMLINLYEHSIETDDTTTIAGRLLNGGCLLILPCETKYFVQPDKSL